ncbi:MAG: adenosine kinase, partial [Magnetococcales bacterium]|nr:adenosine kinase [Magnetococcales bacterium]
MSSRFDIYGIGHALVDIEAEVDDALLAELGVAKGTMALVSEEEQTRILERVGSAARHRTPGGSAANTVLAVTQFGGNTFFSARVGDNEPGRFFAGLMGAQGVENRITDHLADGMTGHCVVLVTPDAERTMCTHLGVSAGFSAADLEEERLAQSEYLYIEGYLVSSPSALEAALAAQAMAKKHGVKVALTASDVSMIDFFRDGMDALLGNGVDLLFCNEAEALHLAGSESLTDAEAWLRGNVGAYGLTLGAQGAKVRGADGEEVVVPGVPAARVVDTNGAGDLFAGAYLYGITSGNLDLKGAGTLACHASSVLVGQFGARLKPGQ